MAERRQHHVLRLPACRKCGKPFGEPYKRRYYDWGAVHYVTCCGIPDAIDVIGAQKRQRNCTRPQVTNS